MSKRVEFIKSATLIILSAIKNAPSRGEDYKIMFLKRNKNMRVAPGHSVFPGGKYDAKIDGSPRWLEILKSNNHTCLIGPNSIGSLRKTSANTKSNDAIPIELSYRLCAIRETFEETGILLASDRSKSPTPTPALMSAYLKNTTYSDSIRRWRERVLDDSARFVDMFDELKLVPGIFGLHEWSNWLTPSFEKTRFDTFFFTCFLEALPEDKYLFVNKQEIESLEVFSIIYL